jgi:hypothetical protein
LFSRVDQAGNLIYNHASSTYGYAYDFTILANGNIAVLGDKDSVTRIMFGYDSSGVELWEINYSNDEDRAWCYFVQSDDSSNITIAGIQRDSMSGPNVGLQLLKYGLSSIVTSIPQKVNTSFNVFPNPVSDKLIIEGDYLNALEIRN